MPMPMPNGAAGIHVIAVEPGLLVRDLIRCLASRNLSLPSSPMLLDQTVGGAISTGSHGSSCWHGTLSDAVVGVTMVNQRGKIVHLREEVGTVLHCPVQVGVVLVVLVVWLLCI